jgi:hypothetical protein
MRARFTVTIVIDTDSSEAEKLLVNVLDESSATTIVSGLAEILEYAEKVEVKYDHRRLV